MLDGSYIEAYGSALIGVLVVDEVLEVPTPIASDPRFLEGLPVVEALAEVGERERVRSEQPLVRRANEDVGLNSRYIERQRSHRLRRVDH